MGQVDDNKRQEIYDKIKESSKDSYVLSEMKRLGFWDENEQMPSVSSQLIKREAELSKEIYKLSADLSKFSNRETLLNEIRKNRMLESRKKQEETKARRKQEKEERAKAWQEKQEKNIVYLGEEVSKGLNNTESDNQRLVELNLPAFSNVEDMAKKMELTVNELRFLSFTRKTSTVSHYTRFFMEKKTGGKRMISAPKPRLKKVQNWLLENLLYKLQTNEVAHGFIPNKSILTNAMPHINKKVVINMDLKNFFPSLTYERVKGMYKSFGYSEQISIILALLTTEPEVAEVELDDQSYFVSKSARYLPQGAPSSPAITNIICRKLDARLIGIAKHYGFEYTRYADDLTFSSTDDSTDSIRKLIAMVNQIVKEENFRVHPDKLKVLRSGRRQEVTGVVVNEKPSVNRKEVKKFKALLFQIEKDGIEDKVWRGKKGKNMLSSIKGFADFIYMIDKDKGEELRKRVKKIIDTIK
ncbi:MAG: reverse transcriptase family protein [Hyphomicrobiales bacterium]